MEYKKNSYPCKKHDKKRRKLLLLHLNILIFSFTGVFSKLTAVSIREDGLISAKTILLGGLILLNCGVYAVFWQYILKLFEVNVAYSHSAVYNVWSLIWAWLFFSEPIRIGNLIGTALIMWGIWVIRNE